MAKLFNICIIILPLPLLLLVTFFMLHCPARKVGISELEGDGWMEKEMETGKRPSGHQT